MSLDREQLEDAPLTTVQALEDGFRAAERPAGGHQVGLEHEKFLYTLGPSPAPVAYEGPQGVDALLTGLLPQGYTPFHDASAGGVTIALQRGVETISLEPGGQLELS